MKHIERDGWNARSWSESGMKETHTIDLQMINNKWTKSETNVNKHWFIGITLFFPNSINQHTEDKSTQHSTQHSTTTIIRRRAKRHNTQQMYIDVWFFFLFTIFIVADAVVVVVTVDDCCCVYCLAVLVCVRVFASNNNMHAHTRPNIDNV